MGGNCARERLGFDISTKSDKFIWCHCVINALHGLVNDWAFIEVFGDIVRCRPNQFYAPGIGLVVRFSAFKAWQKGMVNIDNLPTEIRTKRVLSLIHI